ncbi:MAG: DUF2889 domain-containing protein [Variovorax sp.]|nr:MAG: DUF2889 domain-containing protein [Variovorax sp.]
MQALPESVPREPVHTRAITTRGFLRADGLWDLEAELVDTKAYSTVTNGDRFRPVGEPVHHMHIRLTIDDTLTVQAATAAMTNTPFAECAPAANPFDGLVGAKIGPGWRKQVDTAMGGVRGCTHLRELLGVMATVAFQTVPGYRRHQRRLRGEAPEVGTEPGHQMGKCLAWDFDGPVIARIAPQFIGYRPKASSR